MHVEVTGSAGDSLAARYARPGTRAWTVLAILCFVYVLNFLDRQLLSILAKPIQDELGVTDGQLGLISGLSQYLGSAGLGSGDGNRTIVIAGGVGDATAQAAMQLLNRFLNRLPPITIREGHRVKVYLTSDIELPAYMAPGASNSF